MEGGYASPIANSAARSPICDRVRLPVQTITNLGPAAVSDGEIRITVVAGGTQLESLLGCRYRFVRATAHSRHRFERIQIARIHSSCLGCLRSSVKRPTGSSSGDFAQRDLRPRASGVFAQFLRFYARFGHFFVDSDKVLHTVVGCRGGDLHRLLCAIASGPFRQ
jgi:hypothetical protein